MIKLIVIILYSISIFLLGYFLGHLHYQKKILNYKLTEFVFYILMRVDEYTYNQILNVIHNIGSDSIEIKKENLKEIINDINNKEK